MSARVTLHKNHVSPVVLWNWNRIQWNLTSTDVLCWSFDLLYLIPLDTLDCFFFFFSSFMLSGNQDERLFIRDEVESTEDNPDIVITTWVQLLLLLCFALLCSSATCVAEGIFTHQMSTRTLWIGQLESSYQYSVSSPPTSTINF